MPQWISDIITVSPVLAGICLFILLCAAAWRYLRPPTRGLNHFLEDWNGEAAREGVAARPGVMRRFQALEEWQTKYGPIIDKMDHELHPNSGSSMADAVNRTERSLNEHIAACPATVPTSTTINVTGAVPVTGTP